MLAVRLDSCLRSTGRRLALAVGVVLVAGCTRASKPVAGPPAAAAPTPPAKAARGEPASSCSPTWVSLFPEQIDRCVDHWLARDELDVAFDFLGKAIEKRRDPVMRFAYRFADLSAEHGRAATAAATFGRLGTNNRARALGEGVLALHVFQRTRDDAQRAIVQRTFQDLLAHDADEPFALALGLRYLLAVASAAPPALNTARETCQTRLARFGADTEKYDPVGLAEVLGVCAEIGLAAGAPGEARERFAESLQFDPQRHRSRLQWAHMELAAGNLADAARLFEAELRGPAPHDRLAAGIGLGVARARSLDRQGAAKAYDAAIAAYRVLVRRPELPKELQFNLGTLLAESDDPRLREQARGILREFVARPDVDESRRLRSEHILLRLDELAGLPGLTAAQQPAP